MLPSSHSTRRASRATFACQKLSAITAIPAGMATTLRTPGIERARASSKLFIFAPKIGGRAMTAVNIPGNFTSIPNSALPFNFSGVSSRLIGLPISLNVFGSLSCTFAGGVSLAAADARCPYVRLRFGPFSTAPDSVRQMDGSTFHCCAAAAISMARAAAPAWRNCSSPDHTLELPPVICMPKAG